VGVAAVAEDADDDHDDGPRVQNGDRIPVLLLIGLIAGPALLAVFFVFCGISTVDFFSGSGGGWTDRDVEINSVQRSVGFNGTQLTMQCTVRVANAKQANQYYAIVQIGEQIQTVPFPMSGIKNAIVTLTTSIPNVQLGQSISIWIEKRSDPNRSGKVVSNVYRL